MVDGGHGKDGASASAGRVPVILVCSTSDLELADEAAAGLRTRGYDVAVLGAAEEGTGRLSEVVERFHRQGLYVLCRGGELDRDGVDALRATLRTMDVPFGRTLTLSTGQGGARGLEERVVSVARRMVTGRFDGPDASAEPEDDVSASPPELVPSSGVDQSDVDRWADSLAHGAVPTVDPRLGEDVPTAVAGDPAQASDQPDAYEPVDRTLVARHPIPSATEREESSAPSPTPASMPDDDDISASAFSSGPNLRLVVGGGVALLLILVLAIAFSGSDDPEPTTPDEVAVRDDAQRPEEPDPGSKQDADPEADEHEPAEAAPAEPAADQPPEPEPEPEPEGVVDEHLAELDLEGAEKSLAHRSTVDLALLDDRPLPPSAPEDRAAIAQALEEREIRSWDAFLIAGEEAPAMAFKDAETFCKTLTAGDIAGWRLPSIGELLSLSGAKILDRKGVFWSETPGDAFGDTRMVVNAKKGSTSAVRTDWDGARPICVRVRE